MRKFSASIQYAIDRLDFLELISSALLYFNKISGSTPFYFGLSTCLLIFCKLSVALPSKNARRAGVFGEGRYLYRILQTVFSMFRYIFSHHILQNN